MRARRRRVFFLEADQERRQYSIRRTSSWRNSRLSLMGTLLAEAKALRLDMDISADRLVWEEISAMVEGKGNGET